MKYIKYFESIFTNKEIKDNMNDYMIPLCDKGFVARISVGDSYMVCEIGKSKNHRAVMYEFSEIKEEICGLINFVKKNYDIDINEIFMGSRDNKGFHKVDDLSTISDDEVIYEIDIYFLKK